MVGPLVMLAATAKPGVVELKAVWSEDPERCYRLYRIAGKTIKIRGVFGRRLIAEIFSPATLRWEFLAMNMEPIAVHTNEHMARATAVLLDEVKLILDSGGQK